jgi:hypothetical protein
MIERWIMATFSSDRTIRPYEIWGVAPVRVE